MIYGTWTNILWKVMACGLEEMTETLPENQNVHTSHISLSSVSHSIHTFFLYYKLTTTFSFYLSGFWQLVCSSITEILVLFTGLSALWNNTEQYHSSVLHTYCTACVPHIISTCMHQHHIFSNDLTITVVIVKDIFTASLFMWSSPMNYFVFQESNF